MNLIKKLALITIVSSLGSLSAMDMGNNSEDGQIAVKILPWGEGEDDSYEVKILPWGIVYYHEDALTNLSFGIKEVDGKIYSKSEETIQKDKKGHIIHKMQMNVGAKQVNIGPVVRKIAVEFYCKGFNEGKIALKNYTTFPSIFPSMLFGIGIGASFVGLAWWLKSHSYF